MSAKFWVVWNPKAGPPSVRHLSFAIARAEAARLAAANPGGEFYVLTAEGHAVVQRPAAWVAYRY